MDFAKAASVTGSKFAFMRNGGALLEMELVNWALKTVASKGFTPMLTPDLVRSGVIDACGFQARGELQQVRRHDCGPPFITVAQPSAAVLSGTDIQ